MNSVLFSRKSDEWSTPNYIFDVLDQTFHFTLDPCATSSNAKCDLYYTLEDDGLSQDWSGHVVFCNPPYSNIRAWLEKALSSNCLSVFLLPARVDTAWFHDLIYQRFPVHFLRGRLKFGNSKNTAPFPSMLVIINNF